MANARVIKGVVFEDGSVILLARIITNTGSPATSSLVDSMVLRSFNNKTGTKVVPDGENPETYDATELVIADVLTDTLVTDDPRWEADDEGFNFLYEMAPSFHPEAGVYLVEVEVTPVTGYMFPIVWQFTALNRWSR